LRGLLQGYSKKEKDLSRTIHSIFGFTPGNLELYKTAFRHKSVAKEIRKGLKDSNERLEYLGDAILDSIVAHYLFLKFPYKGEGFLTKMRSKIVSRMYLNELAVKMGIDRFVESQLETNKKHVSIFGNALEALIGAIYLDKGYAFTQKVVNKAIIRQYVDIEELQDTEHDFKSKIIEWSQKERKTVRFQIEENLSESAQHAFSASILIEDEIIGQGTGSSKKKAEQRASKAAWKQIVNE